MWLNFSDSNFDFKSVSYTLPWQKSIFNFLETYTSPDSNLIVKTSGSTGKPKEIVVLKNSMKQSAMQTAQFFKLEKGISCLLNLSADYIAGKMMLVRAIECQWDIFCVAPSSKIILSKNQIFDFGAMVPMQIEESLEDLNAIKHLIIGGAPLSDKISQKLIDRNVNAYQTYGMTETVSHIALQKIESNLKVYKAVPNVQFSLDNRSCLIIDAPLLGVTNLITNDVVQLLNSKQFIWKGRADFVINSGGIKIHPELIEQKLATVLNQDFFVAGIPHAKLGEQLVLILKENLKSNLDFDAIGLNRYEKPKEIIILPDFIYTNSGKLNRLKTLNEFRSY